MKSFRLFFFFVLLSFSFCLFLFALEIPDKPDDYVTDRAHLLSNQTRTQIEQMLQQHEAETSNQVIVATFPSLQEESLEDFSIRLAEKWKVGQKGKDNGVILIIFKDDRKMRIEVGYGLEGALPDAVSGLIIQNVIAPNFRKGNYDQGVLEGVTAILQAVQGEYQASKSTEDNFGKDLLFYILFLGVLFFFSIFWTKKMNPDKGDFIPYPYVPGRRRRDETGFSGGGFGGGGFGGGGFGGGGGGFGGGGASGGW